MTDRLEFFATAPKGVEPLLADELTALGAADILPGRGGVGFRGDLACGYRVCLWSRTASRVLLPLAGFPAADPEQLYAGVRAVPWEDHLSPDGTLAVDFTGSRSAIEHSRYGAQRVKDAVVDRLREGFGRRPSVDRERPDLRINCHLLDDWASLAVDLSGDSLHRRGYRAETVAAPLKENLAAALLLKVGWPALARAGRPLLDPMCGSGTLVIEAALLAADRAPGLTRDYWGFRGWLGHDAAAWTALLAEARERAAAAGPIRALLGWDRDPRAVRAALVNAGRAGVADRVHFEGRELGQGQAPGAAGLLITNPPYGERLGEAAELEALYARLGDWLKAHCGGWRAAVFTGNPELGKRMGLKAKRVNTFYNGPLVCKLLSFEVEPEYHVNREALDRRAREAALREAEPFANRIRKNLRGLGRWAERAGIGCYRLYDADVPEFAVAVDIYADQVHVQEYQPPRSVDPARATLRLEGIMAALPELLGVPPGNLHLKVRHRQSRGSQYQKRAGHGRFFEVREGPCRLLVNLEDYLDTGLFLDHRPTRALLGQLARGKRFLNLFGYTGAATVHAAVNGAAATTTVDLSSRYLDWARRNLELNGVREGPAHRLLRADCRAWLERERGRYDVIFLDPPSFSRSKAMDGTLDVQRDHPTLIRGAARLLAEDGVLVFSTNLRTFRLDPQALAGLAVEDISAATLPRDFQRNPHIHQCFRIRRR